MYINHICSRPCDILFNPLWWIYPFDVHSHPLLCQYSKNHYWIVNIWNKFSLPFVFLLIPHIWFFSIFFFQIYESARIPAFYTSGFTFKKSYENTLKNTWFKKVCKLTKNRFSTQTKMCIISTILNLLQENNFLKMKNVITEAEMFLGWRFLVTKFKQY